ncbi:MAG TPA: rhomboid family intramembrane serine protease [Myxococcaceae bacterium]|nr:rhomboid family intramembrane serine protease [Myxococcaceae bacterium]
MTGVIPIEDASRRPGSDPVITIGLIAINVIVFVVELIQGQSFVLRWAATAADISAGHRLWTLLTAMFLHASWSHIVGNMVFFWVFGPGVEDAMGPVKYLLFYLAGGVVAFLAQVLVTPSSTIPMLGASGAIAAVMGAFLVMYPRHQIKSAVFFGFWWNLTYIPAAVLIGVWFLLQLVSIGTVGQQEGSTSGGGVAYVAHVAGMAFGALTALIFGGGERSERKGEAS